MNTIPKYCINLLQKDSKDSKSLEKYLKIIKNAIKQKRIKLKKDDRKYIYYENHHILPKSLYPKYKDNKNIQVLLTAEEHFIVHFLLTKILPSKQMAACALLMTKGQNGHKYVVTPEQYKELRESYAKNPPCKGIKRTPEQCKAIGDRCRGRKLSKKARKNISNAHKGLKQSKEQIEKRTAKLRGIKRNDKLKKQISDKLKGHKVLKKTKKKLSEINKNKKYEECLKALNKIFTNEHGTKYKIIEIVSYRKVKIKFLDQYGYEKIVDINSAIHLGKKCGNIINIYDKTIKNKGCLGKYFYSRNYEPFTSIKYAWYNLLDYIGPSNKFCNFEVFIDYIKTFPLYNKYKKDPINYKLISLNKFDGPKEKYIIIPFTKKLQNGLKCKIFSDIYIKNLNKHIAKTKTPSFTFNKHNFCIFKDTDTLQMAKIGAEEFMNEWMDTQLEDNVYNLIYNFIRKRLILYINSVKSYVE